MAFPGHLLFETMSLMAGRLGRLSLRRVRAHPACAELPREGSCHSTVQRLVGAGAVCAARRCDCSKRVAEDPKK